MRTTDFGGRSMVVVLAAMSMAAPAVAAATGQDDPYSAPDPYAVAATPPAIDPNDPAAREALLRARGETYHRAPDTQQTEEELRTTRALNAEIVAQNALAAKQEEAQRLDHDAAVLRHRIEAERLETERQIAADAARAAQEQYDRDYAAWEARADACRGGQRAACAPPVPRR